MISVCHLSPERGVEEFPPEGSDTRKFVGFRSPRRGGWDDQSDSRRADCSERHSSIKVTLDTYGHLFPALDEALTDGLETQYQTAISEISRPVRGLSELSLSA